MAPLPNDTLMTGAVTELVAIGAAMACNCEPCFKYHYNQARKLGVSAADMRKAVSMALSVKATAHRRIVEVSERFLSGDAIAEDAARGCSSPAQSAG